MNLNPFRTAAARLFGRRTPAARPSHRPRRRHGLGLEALEGRDVPSVAAPDYLLHASGGSPAWSSSPTSSGGFSPDQIRHAYGIDAISFGGIVGDGSGQTIAIVDAYDDPNIAGDLAAFDAYYGTTANGLNARSVSSFFTKVNEAGGSTLPGVDPTGGWEIEESLDVEWAHAIAPKANIILVECTTNSTADLEQNGVNWARQQPGVSVVSMSFGTTGDFSGETSLDPYFTTPSGHAGVTFVASTGDHGTPGGYPALSPNVLAVGGTSLSLTGSGTISSESVWNNGVVGGTLQSTGGGVSSIESRPAYQNGVAGVVGSNRGIPDVAFDADPNTGVAIYDSYNGGSSTPWEEVGGTSFSAPAWAGLIAVADQGRAGAGLGTLDGPSQTLPAIYLLSAGDFHDVTTGNKGTVSASSGYDLATGRGTPAANVLISELGTGSWQAPPTGQASLTSAAGNGILAADFPGSGISLYTPAGGWKSLGTADANSLAVNAAGDVAASFPGYGVYFYSHTSGWSAFWPSVATQVGVSNGAVFANFNGDGPTTGSTSGLYEFTGSTGWVALGGGTAPANSFAVNPAGDVAASFPGYGVYIYSHTSGWSALWPSVATQVGISNGAVFANFNGDGPTTGSTSGLYEFTGSTGWVALGGGTAPANTFAVNPAGDVVASFPGYGVYFYNPVTNSWSGLWSGVATQVAISDTADYANFNGDGPTTGSTSGLYEFAGSTGWIPLQV